MIPLAGKPWPGVLLVAAAAAGIYINTLGNGFVWDDHVSIESNAFVQEPSNARKILSAGFFRAVLPLRGGGRPLAVLSWTADRALWGAKPRGFHAVNALLHGACAALVFVLGLEILASAPGAFVAGLLFAVHPIHTEAVDVVSFRSDLLAAFFVLLGLWGYLQLSRRKLRSGGLLAVAALLACYFLGVLSKEMALTLPGLALLFEWIYPNPGPRKERLLRLGLLVALPAALAGWYLVFRAPRTGFAAGALPLMLPSPAQWDAVYGSARVNAMTMSWVLAEYFRLMVIPIPLEIDRAPRVIVSIADGWLWASWLLLALLAWAVLAPAARRRRPAAAFGLGWCFLTLVPVANAVPIYNVMAERYLYLVSAGACWALAALWEGLPRPALRAGAAGLLISAYAGRTWARNRDYKDDAALYFSGGARFVDSARLHVNRGLLYQRSGAPEPAAAEFRRALELHPRYVEARVGLGLAYDSMGLSAKALEAYREAAALSPRYPLPYALLGDALSRAGQEDESKRAYAAAQKVRRD